jgi:small subunit ribosomal protein S21
MPKVTPRYKQEPFDKMLRRFRNQCERAGIVKRVREKEYYVKPNEKKHRKNQELIRTRKNQARKAAAAEMRRKQSSSWR